MSSEQERQPGTDAIAGSLLAQLRARGAPVDHLVLTDNRRTMLSLGGARRRTLRLHRHFATAPAAVLDAVVRLLTARRRDEQARARATVRDFVAAQPAAPAARRRRRVVVADRPHLVRLQAEFDRVNRTHFGGRLLPVPLYLSGRMRRRNGHFSRDPLEIVLARQLCTHAAAGEAEHTLRHEMIHLWQHQEGLRPGHGADFRAWARRLDVHPRACRAVRWETP